MFTVYTASLSVRQLGGAIDFPPYFPFFGGSMAPVQSRVVQQGVLVEEEMLLCLLLHHQRTKKTKSRRPPQFWVHPLWRKRREQGAYHNLIQDLLLFDTKFYEYFRFTREQFAQLLYLVEEELMRQRLTREPICPRQRLAICVRYLATGESFRSLAFSFRMGVTTIARIVWEVCAVLWSRLSPIYLNAEAQTAEDWQLLAANFEHKWNFPNCVGALDGKHVVIKAPDNSGSLFYNYKGAFSIVLLSLVDANYRFVVIDVGSFGKNSDGGVFANSNLGRRLQRNELSLPQDTCLPDAAHLGPFPHVIVGDAAFPLHKHIMRPYPGRGRTTRERQFNYRLSRARRVVENAFGLLAARWRVFHIKIAVQPDFCTRIVKAACCLHNMLQTVSTPAQLTQLNNQVRETRKQRQKSKQPVLPEALHNLTCIGHRPGQDAAQVREAFTQYFCDVHPLPWQMHNVMRGNFE